MSEQPRRKGRFETKRKIQWKDNVIAGVKRRRLIREEHDKPKIDGHRIVNITKVAEDMWCWSCNASLSFRHIENETVLGLASIFHVRCQNCNKLKRVNTSDRETNVADNRKRKFDINYKVALGVIDGGIGITQLNTVLSAMNIPTIHATLLKRYERSVGVAIESAAKESCVEAIKVEKELSCAMDTSRAVQSEDPVLIAASYDAAWPKRGNGHTYDSLAAVGSLIGAKSGMVIGYGTRLCQAGHSLDDHDCRLNWTGSAKAMEPDIAIEIIAKNKDFEEHNVKLGTLIGDDDSSSIAAVCRECSHPVAKWSDLNHATKKLSKALWAQKVPRDVIEYLKYCFGCALKKNKGNVEATENAIKNIIPHAFDEHAKCGEWYRYAEDPENYTHNGLPGGKGLTGETMRQTLAAIFDVFWKNADKLAPCGSSQPNEAFNSSVSAKSCKAHHYAGSESFDFRVAATVCEKNIGTKYIVDLNKKLGLSP
ncbi:uncharacterized protein [Temnothorax longispinosus]|uniref:uncharacterized protein n=1 Tax=Temnothorax longispinosus TaxID=300112 RepID=UPI003A9914B6